MCSAASARGRDVRRIFATEGVAVALAGGLLGIPVGYLLDRILVRLIWEIVEVRIPFVFSFWSIPLVLAGTVVLALVVLVVPLRRAVRLEAGRRAPLRLRGGALGTDTTRTPPTGRRALLLAVAALMCAAAALAIAILLFGDFGDTEGRVLATTFLLAVYAALAVPAAMLWDQRRLPALAALLAVLAAVAAF